MAERDLAQWMADNDRLTIAGLQTGARLLEYDEETIASVQALCQEMFGERAGLKYFLGLVGTLPDRRPDLFPELADFVG